MVENRHRIQVNIKSNMFRAVPEVVANDKVIFEIEVWDGSTKFALQSDYSYKLTSLKLGGQSVIRDGTLFGDLIVFELGTSEMTIPGKVEGTVQIFDANNDRISSAKFDYVVKRDPSLQGSLPADNTSLVIANESLLTEAITKADNADDRIDNIVAQAGTDNTEIVDMRLRTDGTVASTAGGHLRELSNQLADIAINVKSFGAKGDGVTNDSQAILNALAVSKNLYFPDGEYLVTFSPDVAGSFFTFTDQKNIRIKGKGATIKDGNTYTVDALTNVFKFVRCQNIEVDVNFDALPLANPNADLGYKGSSALYFEENCSFIKVDSVINNMRYGVRSGNYSEAAKGYCKNFNLRLKTYYTGYPTALYLAENIQVDIDADGVHRAGYFAGCHHLRGVISYGDFAMATMNVLLTNSLTSAYTTVQADQRARGCVDVSLKVVDRGSTSSQSARAMVGLSIQWVAIGTNFENIKLDIQTITSDVSRTIAGFALQSKVKTQRTEYLYNWEDYITFRDIVISGNIDRSAQTLANSVWGDLYIEGYDPDDMTYVHAPVFSNVQWKNLNIIKPGNIAMNSNILRLPKITDVLLLENLHAKNINFAISAPQGITKLSNSTIGNISSYDTIAKLIQEDSTVGTVSGVTILNVRDFGASSGTWTPKLEGTTTPGANTYSVQKGSYYKIGKLVKLTFLITLSAKDANLAGNLLISGLPFAAKNSDERAGVSLSLLSNVTLNSGYNGLVGNLSSNTIKFFQVGSGVASMDLPSTAIGNTTAIWGSITYESVN